MLMRDGIMIATLWRSGLFDSCDIANALGQAEADVMRVIEALRAGVNGPRLVAGADVRKRSDDTVWRCVDVDPRNKSEGDGAGCST